MKVINCYPFSFGRQMEPAPAVQAYCYLNRLGTGFWEIFMVDTGAAGTCLHGANALAIQQYLRSFTLKPASGVGGDCWYYGERATLLFYDTSGKWVSRTLNRFDIQQFTPNNVILVPSLLGRDILNRWKLHYDYSNGSMFLVAT